MNTHPRSHSPEDFALGSRPGATKEKARLLEVRTESGTLYVCPSKWQRLRLLWTFRHFHVLPQQVLSRRDQHLVDKLARSAVITPIRPVPRSAIMGVVERARIKPMGSASQVVTIGTPKAARWSPLVPGLPAPGHHQRLFFESPSLIVEPANQRKPVSGVRFRQWGALGVLTAVCLVVILVKSYVLSPPARTVQLSTLPSPPVAQAAVRVLPPVAPLPVKPRHRPANPLMAATTFTRPNELLSSLSELSPHKPALIAPLSATQRTFVVELPQGHFAAPIAADPNRVGELHLRALIAADGSVKAVTVVSGDPKLAQAGMRAVRRWRYNPYEASATQAERETLINMKFFGQDAVSVTSVAR